MPTRARKGHIYLNFSIPNEVYHRIKAMMARMHAAALERNEKDPDGNLAGACRTWAQFMERVSDSAIEIPHEILFVDGKRAEDHTVTFLLGDCVYRWNGKRSVLVADQTMDQVKFLVAMKLGAGMQGR